MALFKIKRDDSKAQNKSLIGETYNSQSDNINQNMIKSVINDESNEEESSNYQYDIKIPVSQSSPLQKQNIFVKVDKLSVLQNALSDIQGQIRELSKQVDLLRDVKTKQIQEISNWDTEMKKINQKLTKFDSDIFGEI